MYSSGLQAEEGIHHCPESHGEHLQRFLEDGCSKKLWSYHHAVSNKGEWKGIYDVTEVIAFFSAQSRQKTTDHWVYLCGSSWQETCAQYWPSVGGDTLAFGEYFVQVQNEVNYPGFVERTLLISEKVIPQNLKI